MYHNLPEESAFGKYQPRNSPGQQPRCTWCNLQFAMVECKNCPPPSNVYCNDCATKAHSEDQKHTLVFLNNGLGHPAGASQVPVFYQYPPQQPNSYTPPIISHSPGAVGGLPPEVIIPRTEYHANVVPINTPTFTEKPTSVTVITTGSNLYPNIEVRREPTTEVVTFATVNESTPLLRTRQESVNPEVSGLYLPVKKEETGNSRSLSLFFFVLLIASSVGKVFYDHFVALNSDYYDAEARTFYSLAITTPILFCFVFAVHGILGLFALAITRSSLSTFLYCLVHPLLLLPGFLLSGAIALPWWACTPYPQDSSDVCAFENHYFGLRNLLTLALLAILSLIFSRSKKSASIGALAGLLLGAGTLMIYWDVDATWNATWQASAIQASLILLSVFYLGSIRLALRRGLTRSQVFFSQSLWGCTILSALFFGWNPEWSALHYYDYFFKSDAVAPFGGAVGIYGVFFACVYLLVAYSSAQIGGLSAVFGTLLAQVLLVACGWVGYRWTLFNYMQLYNGQTWDWDGLNGAGVGLIGVSFLVLVPTILTVDL